MGFWWGNIKERENLENIRVDGMMTKIDVDEMVLEVLERILLFHDRSEWRAAGVP